MGLCKCSKRRVTNLFCFVHRVNVCEDCLVAHHERCIVQSYLRWLEDSDYDPVCALCTNSLLQGEVIRLICYDLFHVSCLDHYLRNYSYDSCDLTCPKCKDSMVPPDNLMSPVAQVVHSKLQQMKWKFNNVQSKEYVECNVEDVRKSFLNDEKKETKRSSFLWSTLSRYFRSSLFSISTRRGVGKRKYFIALFCVIVILAIFILAKVGRNEAEKDSFLDWKSNPNLRTRE